MSGADFDRGAPPVLIRCRDLTAMEAFYRDVLGFEELEEEPPAEGVVLRGPGAEGPMLVLLPDPGAEGEGDDGGEDLESAEDAPPVHLTLVVGAEEMAAAEERLRSRGAEIEKRDRPGIGWCSLVAKDPEGNWVELVLATGQEPPPG